MSQSPTTPQARFPAIRLDQVGKRFGDHQVLEGIDLEVAHSEVVCLIGPSGSGKSTLLRCMAFLEHYDQGEIYIEGALIGWEIDDQGRRRRASNRRLRQSRSNLGMVFQQFNLWPHMTALGNVSEALKRVKGLSRLDAERRGRQALERVGLLDKADAHPARLSGGQQQRVAIARALAMEPKIMLFDEPTSALDPELVGEVLAVMKRLASEGMTMVVVTHEMGFAARMADTLVFLDHGRIIARGAPAQVFGEEAPPRVRQFLQDYLERNALLIDANTEAPGAMPSSISAGDGAAAATKGMF
ncbi:amino acid ABC transporter ATP-binding protein [Halotalea alkalilenta]|uniref:amino acid ABC transporter ATP-binding protein n=1 Tax=Halotalea alkalilenta TaxID=376489 RepID=UPI0009DF15B1|nr:amino acid ABC transporter ATP-binding protein [Halotalea alkalilenta]